MYERGDSNPHTLRVLDPKSSASTNSATLASGASIQNKPNEFHTMNGALRRLNVFSIVLLAGLSGCTPPRQVAQVTGRPIPPPPRTDETSPTDDLKETDRYTVIETGRFDDGKMWTFDNVPEEYFESEYGLELDSTWFSRARLGALRFSDSCSASFVSARGLVMTNHHCARASISDAERDGEGLHKNGFYAQASGDEREIDDLYVEQLIKMEDVTDEILKAASDVPGAGPQAEARRKRSEAIERRTNIALSRQDSSLHAEVIELHAGSRYSLYTYRKYEDVRLVFAPELMIGYFGGDTDNFSYPRHTIDLSFFRVWDNGFPIATADFFAWGADGAEAGDPVFVVGNPASTSRRQTVSQLEYLRDVELPAVLEIMQDRIEVLSDFVEDHRALADSFDVRNNLMSARNIQKSLEGQYMALLQGSVLSRTYSQEKQLRDALQASDSLNAEHGSLHSDIALLQGSKRASSAKAGAFYQFLSPAVSSHILTRAVYGYFYSLLSRRGLQPEPLREIYDEALEIRDWPDELEKLIMARRIRDLATYLGPTDPTMKRILTNLTPEQLADSIVTHTALGDSVKYREILSENYLASEDVTVDLINAIAPLYFTLDTELRSLSDREDVLLSKLARAHFSIFDDENAPDATFSLRIADGRILGYDSQSGQQPAFTTIGEMLALADEKEGQEEWDLPESWDEKRSELTADLRLNFVSTNDIASGNSGSAILNADLQIVGLIFDSNSEAHANEFVYSDARARAISVDVRAIIDVLRTVYDADRLVSEILDGIYVESEEELDS